MQCHLLLLRTRFFSLRIHLKGRQGSDLSEWPLFHGPQGLYLNRWMLDFDPAVDVPSAVLVWVRLPNLPVHCWNWDLLKHIRNTLMKFIDRVNNKDEYDCACICVEVDLEVGLPEAIKIKVGN